MSFIPPYFGTAAQMAAANPLVPKGIVAGETDTGVIKVGDGLTRYNSLSAALSGTYGQGSDQWLKECAAAFSFAFTSITTTDATTGLPTAANVQWPDGTTGAFTGTIDGGSNGYSGYVVTYVGSTTKNVTASGITYDANGTALGPTSLAVA